MASIFFTHPLLGAFLMNKNGEKNLIDMDLPQGSEIFKTLDDAILTGGFDYFFYRGILIIPDIVTSHKVLSPLSECQIEGMGDLWVPFYNWVMFLSYTEQSDGTLLANSLNLPDQTTVRNGLQYRNRLDFNLIEEEKEESIIYSRYSNIEKLK